MHVQERHGKLADPHKSPTALFALGGIARKPGVIGDKIAVREYLCMTILFDHDVVDGAPAARFFARLAELVENGFGLIED